MKKSYFFALIFQQKRVLKSGIFYDTIKSVIQGVETEMEQEFLLEMNGIDKRFLGVHALKGVNLNLKRGEVLALVGENGAGKSTLMKVLTGIHQPDGGSMTFEGKPYSVRNIRESLELGIGMIHQELNMMNHLTVAQNIFIGRESMVADFWINDGAMIKKARELFDYIGINIDPTVKLGSLTVGKQQMVEIAKAVSHNTKLLILDEPTAALTQSEIEELFKIMGESESQRDRNDLYFSPHGRDQAYIRQGHRHA